MTSHEDKRLSEVTEALWNASRFRSEMTAYEVAIAMDPSDDVFCNVWLQQSKVFQVKDFDGLVELFVRELKLNLSCAKHFS